MMGQEEVLQAIEEFEVLTFSDLKEILDLTDRAISHSLTQLNRWNEIDSVVFHEKTIYFSEEFLKQIENG